MAKRIFLIIVFSIGGVTLLFAQKKDSLNNIPRIPTPPKAGKYFPAKVFSDWFKLSPKQEKEALKNLPDKISRMLEKLKKYDLASYYKILWKSKFKFWKFPFFIDRKGVNGSDVSQQINELELETEILGAQFKIAKGKEKAKIKAKLLNKLSRLFDLKEETRKKELNELKEKIAQLKKSIEKRIKNKNLIIERRFEELTGEEDYLKWDE